MEEVYPGNFENGDFEDRNKSLKALFEKRCKEQN